MPTTLTLKNIPDKVYDRLKTSAEAHRRSLNSEAIACLKSALMPASASTDNRIKRARMLRAELPKKKYPTRDINSLKDAGRQ